MAWIEVHQALLTHRKTLKLAKMLRMDKYAIVGRLVSLWGWALDNAPDGNLGSDFSELISEVMGWNDDPADLLEALVQCGFIDKVDDEFYIHDWMEYAGRLIEKRKSDAERKRRERHEKDIRVTSNGHPRDGAGTVPNRTVPNPTPPDPVEENDQPPLKALPSSQNGASARAGQYPLYDALVEVVGHEPLTKADKAEWKEAGKLLKNLGATPDDIRQRGTSYREKWPTLILTPNALVKFWHDFAPDAPSQKSRAGPSPPATPKQNFKLFGEPAKSA